MSIVRRVNITDVANGFTAKVNHLGETGIDIPVTAFGDVRTAELTPIIQNSFEYTVSNTELNELTETAGGTVTQSNGTCVLDSSTTTGSVASLRSRRHAKYRSGLGGLMRFTARFASSVAGTEQLAGLADEVGSSVAFKNGFMVGFIGTTFGFHRFANDAITTVAQSAWDDPMDGTGRSGMTLDTSKFNVYGINFQYLGAGKIDLLIEDDATGKFVIAHSILYANNYTAPSVYNPNFHCTFHVDNKATASPLLMYTSSYAFFIEGKTQYYELHQPQFSTGQRQKTTVTTETAIVTIRNKSTYASKTNFIDAMLERFSGSIEATSANNLGSVRLVRDATIGGTPSYTDISTTDSIIDYDVAGTTVTGGKTLISVPLANKNDRIFENLLPYRIILRPGETITLAGTSANSATITGSLLWKELF